VLDNAEIRLVRLFEFTPMTESKFKLEWDKNQAQKQQIEQQIGDIEDSIQNYSIKVYSEDRVRELAGTLKGVLAFAGEGYIREKRQLFEDLHMRVLVSDGTLQAVELALPAIKSDGDTVLQHS